MHYFPSRMAAGDMIADQLEPKYRYEDTAILALSDGAVIVGAAIAKRLHSVINMLFLESIHLPRETDALATINNFGGVVYNSMYSPGELEMLKAEYFHYIEQQKLQKLFAMNEMVGAGGVLDPQQLRNRVVIVVSDGLTNGFSMKAASEFLKPIKIKRLVMVTPFASVSAIDQMHILADEMVCLNVNDNILSIDHYYDDNTMPAHEKIVEIVEDIVLQWR